MNRFLGYKYGVYLLVFSFLFLFMFQEVLGTGKVKEIEIRTESSTFLETKPKEVLTLAFQVANLTARKRELVEEIELPEGWKLIIQGSPFLMEAKEGEVRLLSFFVPMKVLVGDYKVIYRVKDINDTFVNSTREIQVKVLPVLKIEIIPQDVRLYVVAGEAYETDFKVINQSNTGAQIVLKASNRGNFPIQLEENEIYLEVGEAKIVKVRIETGEDLTKLLDNFLRLKVNVENFGGEILEFSGRSNTQIIPRISGVKDKYHRLPSVLKLKGGYNTGFHMEFSGKGTLDEEGKNEIDFLFKKPDILEGETSDDDEEEVNYYVSLKGEKGELYLGDYSFKLSPLTESNLSAEGIKGIWKNEKISAGGYYLNTKDTQKEEWAAFLAGYPFDENWEFKLNCLHKEVYGEEGLEKDDIWSIETKVNIFKDTFMELEYARGENESESGQAWRGMISGRIGALGYSFDILHADPYYPGCVRDTNSKGAAFILPLSERLSVKLSFRDKKKILNLELNEDDAPWEQSMGITLSYKLEKGNMSIFYEDSIRKDIFSPSTSEESKDLLRLTFQQNLGKVDLYAFYEISTERDNLTGQSEKLNKFTLSTSYSPNPEWKYSLHYFNEFDQLINSGIKSEIKLDIRHQLKRGSSLDFSWKANIGEEIDINHQLNLKIQHKFPKGDIIELGGGYSFSGNSFDEGSASLTVSYQIPLSIPVSLKKNIGVVKGRVYDAEDPNLSGLEKVILTMSGMATVTDKKGYFIFRALEAGDYYLGIDYRSIGQDKITTMKMPLEITVQQGEETEINLGVTRKVLLKGRIVRFDFPESSLMQEESQWEEKGGMNNILLEMRSDGEIRRCLSDNKGYFIFNDLRPGKWTFEILNGDLPRRHYVEDYTKEFEFKPGEEKEISLRVLPKKRTIIMIEEATEVIKLEDKDK